MTRQWFLVPGLCLAGLLMASGAAWSKPNELPAGKGYSAAQNQWLTQRKDLVARIQQVRKDDLSQAVELCERVLTSDRQTFGNVHREVAVTLDLLSELYFVQEDYAAAVKCQDEIVAIVTRLMGENHWRVRQAREERQYFVLVPQLAPDKRALYNNGQQLFSQPGRLFDEKKYAEAIAVSSKVIGICQQTIGLENEVVARRLITIGRSQAALNQWDKARDALEGAAEIRAKVLGRDSAPFAVAQYFLAILIHRPRNDLLRTEQLLREALVVFEREGLEGDTLNAQMDLGLTYLSLGQPARAIELFEKASPKALTRYGADSYASINVDLRLQEAKLWTPQATEAEQPLRDLLQRVRQSTKLTPIDRETLGGRATIALADAILKTPDRSAEAVPLLTSVEFKANPNQNEELRLSVLERLSTAYRHQKKFTESAEAALRAAEGWQLRMGPQAGRVTANLADYQAAMTEVARNSYENNRPQDAQAALDKLQKRFVAHFGERSPEALMNRARVTELQRFGELSPEQRKVDLALVAERSAMTPEWTAEAIGRQCQWFARAIPLRESLYGDQDLLRVNWLLDYAYLLKINGQPAEAMQAVQQALQIQTRLYGGDNPPVAAVATGLLSEARLWWERRDFDQAAARLLRLRRLARQQSAPLANDILAAELLLARCQMEMGELDRAELLLQTLQSQVSRTAGDSSNEMAEILTSRFIVQARCGRVPEALQTCDAAVKILESSPRDETRNRLTIYRGSLLVDVTMLDWALDFFQKHTMNYTEANAWRSETLRGRATAHLGLQEWNKAEEFAMAAFSFQHGLYPGDLLACEREATLLATIFERHQMQAFQDGDLDSAVQRVTREAEFWERHLGPDHWRSRQARSRLIGAQNALKLAVDRRQRFCQERITLDQRRVPFFYPKVTPPAASFVALLKSCEDMIGKDNFYYEQIRPSAVQELLAQKNINQAAALSDGALEAVDRLVGRDSELGVLTTAVLVDVFDARGDRTKADSFVLECTRVLSRIYSPYSPTAGPYWLTFGRRALRSGSFTRAESALRKAHAHFSTVPAAVPALYASSSAWYGLCLSTLGNTTRGRQLLDQALSVATRLEAQQPLLKALVLRLRGEHFIVARDAGAAEQDLRQSVELFRRHAGESSEDYLGGLTLIANVLRDKGDRIAPGPLYQQALDGVAARSGKESLPVTQVLHERARYWLKSGDLNRAKADFDQIHQISEKLNAGTAALHGDEADLALLQNDPARARELLQSDFRTLYMSATVKAATQSEVEQLAMSSRLDEAMSRVMSADPSGESYFAALANKGDVLVRQQAWRKFRSVPLFAGMLADWQRATAQLATQALHIPYADEQELWVAQVLDLLVQRDQAERRVTSVTGVGWGILPGVDAVVRSLPDKSALVDYREYTLRLPDRAVPGTWSTERRLAAFVVRRDKPVVRVELGTADAARTTVRAWLDHLNPADRARDSSLEEITVAGRAVRKVIWDPLSDSLQGATTILIAPDGLLTKMPFAALPDDSNGYLIENLALVTVSIPSQLPELLKPAAATKAGGLLAFGDIDFGGNPANSPARRLLRTAGNGTRSVLPYGFPPLEHTGPEVDAVSELFTSQFADQPNVILKQQDCTEDQLRKRAPQARWVHLATHGYYIPDLLSVILRGRAQPGETDSAPGTTPSLNPGILCGLALAGVNFPRAADLDDGIISGLEVSVMDLSQVELAVLSCCESALGQEAIGEGQLGLQRAFEMAGARSVIATLWPVSDAGTRLLMMRFYRNLWQHKMSKLEALRDAQLWFIQSARKASQSGNVPDSISIDSDELPPALLHPRLWAPFVLSGRWD